MLIYSNRVLCSSSLYNRVMKMNNNKNFSLECLGTATLFLCILLSGCASRQAEVESHSPVTVEDDASGAEGNASDAAANAQEALPEAIEVETQAGSETPNIAPVQPEPIQPENIEQATAQKQQPKYNRDDVIWIQQRLKDLGYYEGPIDGSAGKATRNAVMEYQREQDVTADGQPTAELREFMWLNGG